MDVNVGLDGNQSTRNKETPLTLLLKSPQKNAVPNVQPGTSGQVQPLLAPAPIASTLLAPILPPILDTRPTITLQNTVSTIDLTCELDLMKLSTRTRNSEYNPKRFRGCIMRIVDPKSTALVFNTGKVVITGARNEDDSHLAARKFARIIQKIGFKVRAKNFQIRNIVGTCDVRFPIKVEALNQVHAQFARYEPELFPALIYRLVHPRVVLLIFVNGKIVITGAKTRGEMYRAIDTMLPILKSFRKQ